MEGDILQTRIFFVQLVSATCAQIAAATAYDRTTMNSNTKTIATGGICLALAVICLYFASFVPGAELTLYALASVFVAVMADERGVAGGALVYAGASILAFLIVPAKLGILPFVFFFGIYPLIKFYAERIHNRAAQFAVKLVLFCCVFFVAFIFFRELFFKNIKLPDVSVWLLAIGGIVMFILYDYILTMIIKLYRRKVKRQKDDFRLS